jgi:Uncharacterised nucleotidyltransferase
LHRISATPEQAAFLVACLRLACDAAPLTAAKDWKWRLDVSDWKSLLDVSRAHGLLPLLGAHLPELEGSWPRPFLDAIAAESRGNHARNLVLATRLLQLLRAFEHAGIAALPFKGVVLANSLYGDLRQRPAGDIDILIFHDDRERALSIALANGYEIFTKAEPDACEYQLRSSSPDATLVELCWRLTPRSFPCDFGMEALWPHRRATLLLGVPVPDLDLERLLTVLCLHGAKHGWNRLFWIADVARLLANGPNLDWDCVDSFARRYGLWRTLALGVLLCHGIAAAPVQQEVLRRFARSAAARGMAAHLRRHLFDRPLPPYPGLPLEMQFLPLRGRLRWMAAAAFRMPNQRDRALVKVRPGLGFLYSVLRPLRLAWDYGIRPGRSSQRNNPVVSSRV